MKEKQKKQYKYPALNISVSNGDLAMAKELREKYYVNVSAFVREKLKELYSKCKNENS
jgi:hypothetical protein